MICPIDSQPCTGTMDRRCWDACARLDEIKRNTRPAMSELFATSSAKPKVEPPQDMRQAAVMMFQYFTALTDAGFTEAQAIQIISFAMKQEATDDDGG